MKLHVRLLDEKYGCFLTKGHNEILCRLYPFVSLYNFRCSLQNHIADLVNQVSDVYVLLPSQSLRKSLREKKEPFYASFYFINEETY
jgi:hypothetical protein